MQGGDVCRGLQLWTVLDGVRLELVDDRGGSSRVLVETYRRWLTQAGADIVLGPYGSGAMRRVVTEVALGGKLLWNHGGASDDLIRPLVVMVPAPASSYLTGVVRLANDLGIGDLVIGRGRGRFARHVTEGAQHEADRLGMGVTMVNMVRGTFTSNRDVGVMVVGSFEEDVAWVRRIREDACEPALLACVAAGVPQFGARLGEAAEGVIGPSQWLASSASPRVGPSGVYFEKAYREMFGVAPSYVAAQAAATGFLAAAAEREGLSPVEVQRWRTSTLLGPFALDDRWRQVGHRLSMVEWRGGRLAPVGTTQ